MRPVGGERLLWSGLRVSILGAVWTLGASATGIWIGATLGSLSLIAFGGVGILDAAGSVTLAVHFRLTQTATHRAGQVERVAFHVITAGLIAVGLATGAVSVLHLVNHDGARQSLAGTLIAGLSVVVLSMLALRKRWLAVRIPSRALLADSHLSAVGAVLAAVTLAGTVATGSLGWWWADPVAAFGVALVATRLGVEMAGQPEAGLSAGPK
jgi:divalent metal cation (Fe/Co/Zn/Cd) transporter